MTTLAALVEECYGVLYGVGRAERPQEDTLNGGISDSDTTMTVTTEAMWKRGDYAEFDTDGELVIFAADASGATAIRRAQRGTTAAAQADGSVIYRNPTFPRYEIERLITQVVRNELWPNVWTWHNDTLSYTAGDTTYDLGDYIEDVVNVYQYDLNSSARWYPFDQTWWSVERQVNASGGAASGNLLRLAHVRDDSETVYYTAKRRPHINDLANMDDEVAELIPWAVAGKLEGQRSVAVRHRPATGATERMEGGLFKDYRGFMSEFIRMRKALNTKLAREVPTAPRFQARRRRKAF
ncbi:hypothetical protein ACFL0N_01750 [Pseudomonadota bacterium]